MHSFRILSALGIAVPLLFGVLRSQVRSGEITLSGTVVDSVTSEPLEAASVFIPILARGSATDYDGVFRIESIPPGIYEVAVRFLGYREARETMDLRSSVTRRFALSPTTLELPNVTVSARQEKTGLTGSVQSISVMTEQELRQVRGQTIGQTLDKVPGITLMQTGPSIAKPVLRGLHSQRLLITNAGIRQEGQQWGGEHAPEIDPFVVSRVEVLRGAASVEYGSDAIGGVIRLEPRQLRKTPGYAGELTLNGFSNNLQGAGSAWIEGKPTFLPDLSWRIQGSMRKAGDSRTPEYVISNSGFEERDGSVYAGYSTDGLDLSTYYSHFATTLGIFAGSHIGNVTDLQRAIRSPQPIVQRPFTYEILNPRQRITHDLLSVRASYQVPTLGRFEFAYGWQQNQRQEFDAHKPYSDSLETLLRNRAAFDLTLTSYTADLKFHHDPIGPWFGTWGISGTRQGNVNEGTSSLIPNFRVYGGGIFVLEETYQDPWVFNIGARFDYRWLRTFTIEQGIRTVDTHEYQNISGSIGAIYKINAESSVGLNLGTAWRPPSLNELYSDGVHHGTARYEIGDPSLGSERSKTIDLTVRHQTPATTAEVSTFANFFDNYIFANPSLQPTVTIRGAFPTFRFTQARALFYGVDALLEHRLSDITSVGATLSIVRGENQTAGEPLILVPADRGRVMVNVDLSHTTGLKDSFIEAGLTAVRRQNRFPAGTDYSDPPAGYVLAEVSAGTQFHIGAQPFEFYLAVYNLFDTQYRDYLSRFRYFINEPGRNIVVRIHVPFGIHEGRGTFH